MWESLAGTDIDMRQPRNAKNKSNNSCQVKPTVVSSISIKRNADFCYRMNMNIFQKVGCGIGLVPLSNLEINFCYQRKYFLKDLFSVKSSL